MTEKSDGDPLNIDLIQMVQRARMQHDTDAQPSQLSAVYWIEAKAPEAHPTPRAGAIVIPTTLTDVDALWAKLKAATESGELGYKSKVSTSPGKGQGHPDDRMIHLRVADCDDAADINRVREALRRLGLVGDYALLRDHDG
jgi:hypothetical protein